MAYEISQTYPVSRERLLSALTDATVLKKIWGVQQITVDARVGGKNAEARVTVLFREAANGTALIVRMENFDTIEERDANRRAWQQGLQLWLASFDECPPRATAALRHKALSPAARR